MNDDLPTARVVLILNAGSGGGRYQPGVRIAASQRGWTVHEVGPGADPAQLAGSAEADILVAAGGDGTVGGVAGVALERNLPMAVLPCGTRNHFAADAGLDLADPDSWLTAVDDGIERAIDVGSINDRVFLNNVSVGFYSSIVQDPQYRTHRAGVTASYLRRAMLGGGKTLTMSLTTGPRVILPRRVLTVLVSNNAYSPGVAPGPALRPRLDEGMLWVHVLGIDDNRGPLWLRLMKAVGRILTGRTQVAAWPIQDLTLEFTQDQVSVGIDGEGVTLRAPLRLSCRPGALRLLTPRQSGPSDMTIEVHA